MPDSDTTIFSDDPLQAYLAEVSRIPPLERAEEIDCFGHLSVSDAMAETARKRLVEGSLHLVITVAERHREDRLHILDLIQKGNTGLLKAVQNLGDCAPGSFTSHAVRFIEQAVEGTAENDISEP